jgi:hypothetical protein
LVPQKRAQNQPNIALLIRKSRPLTTNYGNGRPLLEFQKHSHYAETNAVKYNLLFNIHMWNICVSKYFTEFTGIIAKIDRFPSLGSKFL